MAIAFSNGVFASSGRAEELTPWAATERPPLRLDRLDGAPLDLASLSGRPVIVHFFATWCAPCIVELASLNALAALPEPKVTIVAVDVGEIDARVRNFLARYPVVFPVLLDRDRSVTKSWQVESLPTSFVLDRDLKPALKVEGPLEWASPQVLRALAPLAAPSERDAASPITITRETKP